VLQPDVCHIGGILVGKKVAALAQPQDILISPHVSVGPVALCAALHLDWCTPNVLIQEDFSEYDVPWRHDLVHGWNPLRHGEFTLPDRPGLGVELDESVCAAHPYRPNTFPSLWDAQWRREFTQKDRSAES